MDPMLGFHIRLVFKLPPRDSTLQQKRCVHIWNNFPWIRTLLQPNLITLIVEIASVTTFLNFLVSDEVYKNNMTAGSIIGKHDYVINANFSLYMTSLNINQ